MLCPIRAEVNVSLEVLTTNQLDRGCHAGQRGLSVFAWCQTGDGCAELGQRCPAGPERELLAGAMIVGDSE